MKEKNSTLFSHKISKKKRADDGGEKNAEYHHKKSGKQRMTGFLDAHRAEINRRYVQYRIARARYDGGNARGKAVGTASFIQLGKNGIRSTARYGARQNERQNIGRYSEP